MNAANVIIPVMVALLGLVLLGMLFAVYRRSVKQFHLRKHRETDLLNYTAVVDDGVIVGKNGSFMASFFYRGADNASATDQERELVPF